MVAIVCKLLLCTKLGNSYCVGNLIGPQLFFEKEAPRYQSGFASMIVCFVVQIAIVIVMYTVNARENKRVSCISDPCIYIVSITK